MSISIREVKTKADLNRFIKLPWRIYKGDPNWVPPLIMDMKTKLNRAKNPYFEHSQGVFFIAERDGCVLGRLAATINRNHNRASNENIGFFGFFECVDDQELANALFSASAEYFKRDGLDAMRGPANFNSNDDWGLLIDAFDKPPVIMMTYNPPYYSKLIENFGFKKVKDILAYWMTKEQITERIIRAAQLIQKRTKITVRSVNMKEFNLEVKRLREVYNSAWEQNWGFVPMTENEFNHLAKDLKLILNPDLVLIAEADGKPVGFSLALPDANQAIKHCNGRLFPFGLLKLMYYMKKVHTLRVPAMGVVPEYRNKGVDVVFYYETFKRGTNVGFDSGEFSWILENNELMNRAAENMGAKKYKTYRIYDYPLK
jgi:GNAT superfamily N-acetyltransferase